MYVLGFDIGGTKSAVVLANIEDTQVSFLGRYERKTVPDWKKVLNELEENGRKIAKVLHEEYFLNKCRNHENSNAIYKIEILK